MTEKKMKSPKILFWDLEITPNKGYSFGGKWQTNILRFEKEFYILSCAFKWLGYKHIECITSQHNNDDKMLCKKIVSRLNEADILIAHNGDSFDVKKLNARLAFHDLDPISPVTTIDTKKVAKKHFAFNSNSLDDLARFFGFGTKRKHDGIDLWLDCMTGDKKAWDIMIDYNKFDVVLLEKIYKRMKKYMVPHPNVAKLQNKMFGCDKCGSDEAIRHGFRPGSNGLRQKWLCKGCGGFFVTALTVAVNS